MDMISNDRLFEFYVDALEHGASPVNDLSDEDFAHSVFEEFDTGAWSFLHDDNLERLRSAGYIDDQTVAASREVRQAWLSISTSDDSVAAFRASPEWRRVSAMCDQLLESLGVRDGK